MSVASRRVVFLILDTALISGAACVIYGVGLIYYPMAWVIGGGGLIGVSVLISRRISDADATTNTPTGA